jgi:hypothetical protein
MSGFIPWNKVDLPLRALRSIWISTTRPDGRPHAVPVWFVWDGASLYQGVRRTPSFSSGDRSAYASHIDIACCMGYH